MEAISPATQWLITIIITIIPSIIPILMVMMITCNSMALQNEPRAFGNLKFKAGQGWAHPNNETTTSAQGWFKLPFCYLNPNFDR